MTPWFVPQHCIYIYAAEDCIFGNGDYSAWRNLVHRTTGAIHILLFPTIHELAQPCPQCCWNHCGASLSVGMKSVVCCHVGDVMNPVC